MDVIATVASFLESFRGKILAKDLGNFDEIRHVSETKL
jgi:hypothetical protein